MVTTRTLGDLASVIRSKNAGPFELTFDILFDDPDTYRRVTASGVLTVPLVARLFRLPEAKVLGVFSYDPALAIKVTVARAVEQGSVAETDTYGAQQHAPLLDIEIPWDEAEAGTRHLEASRPGAATRASRDDYAFQFSPPVRLEPATTALIVVDMQYASACRQAGLGRLLAERGQGHLAAARFARIEAVVIPTIRRLLSFFRAHGLRVIYLTVGSEVPDYADLPPHMRGFAEAVGNRRGRREHAILDELAPAAEELVLNKTTMSAFNSTGIDASLRSLGVRSLVVTGVSTNSCVEGTARDAAEHGYGVVLVEDGCGAANRRLHEASLENFGRLLGRTASAEAVLAELTVGIEAAPARPGTAEQTTVRG